MNNVSVIIPNYNHAIFLTERIESVLNQTNQNFEVIILDDCSTDNSKEIINRYKNDTRISHIIFNDSNSGSPFFQWKKGIELAKHKFIWIAESDDYIDPTFLEEVLQRFNTDEKIGIVYCDSNIVENEKVVKDFYKGYRNQNFNTKRWNNDYVNDGKNEIENYLFFECTINNTSAMVFKKDLIDQNIFTELQKFKYSGDWYFFLCIAYNCKISYISKALNYFRSGQSNFKKGVRSPLNYFRERSLVRYLAIKNFHYDKQVLSNVMKKIGPELKYQIYDLIKGQIDLKSFYSVCKELYTTQKVLFIKQLTHLL